MAEKKSNIAATILIGGDICPIGENRPLFKAGDARRLFNDLLPEMAAADLVIANLECPLIEKSAPILKTGPTFGEASNCINGIKHAGIDVLGLANNHIMDHGATGLANTLAVCARAGIATVGAGKNLAAAGQMVIQTVGGLRIGLLALAENEFSIATREGWGANPLDLIDFVRNVNRRRADFDCLIVLLHGSDEFFAPTPRTQNTCRFMIEMGADAVLVQHPHVLGGYEEYQGGHIVYGQGAWVMDESLYRHQESFHEGFLVKLLINDDQNSSLEIVPFVQSYPPPGARRMEPAKELQFRLSLEEKSHQLLDAAWLEAQWLRFCEERKHDYVSCLLGHNRILGKLNSGGLVAKLLHGKMNVLRAKNIVSCETHREAIETIFNHHLV